MITKFYELRNKYPENIMTDKRNKLIGSKTNLFSDTKSRAQ